MENIKPIEDIFGEELARSVAIAKKYRWGSIQKALTTSYEGWELDPSEYSSVQTARPNTRIVACDDTLAVARKTKQEYGLQKEKEAITKLLRFGLGKLSYRWQYELEKLSEIKDASVITSTHSYTDDFTQSFLSESSKVEVPARTPSRRRSEQIRILWYQKHAASDLSEMLSVPTTDILRCGVLLAGEELGKIGDMPDPQMKRLDNLISKFDEHIQRRIDRVEQLVFGAITVAATSGQGEYVVDELETNCPNLWQSYKSAHTEIDDLIE